MIYDEVIFKRNSLWTELSTYNKGIPITYMYIPNLYVYNITELKKTQTDTEIFNPRCNVEIISKLLKISLKMKSCKNRKPIEILKS